MRVAMKLQISGTRNGEPWPARGETIDLPDDEAAALVAQGAAEPAGETADAAPEQGKPRRRSGKPAGETADATPGGEQA